MITTDTSIKIPDLKKKRKARNGTGESESCPADSSGNPPVVEPEQKTESVGSRAKSQAEQEAEKKKANKGSQSKGPIKGRRGTNGSGSRQSVPNPSSAQPTNSEGRESPGSEGGANNFPSTRRIFTPAFKQSVLEAFATDLDCIGNQRATARKFGVHRRQVQKWLLQLSGSGSSGGTDKGSSSDEPNLHGEDQPATNPNPSTSPSAINRINIQGNDKPTDIETQPEDSSTPSTPSSSRSNSSSQIDLCKMSSAAMALSLNLTMNNLSGGVGSSNKSHTATSASIPMPSPTSLLQKFYGLAFNPNNIPGPSLSNYQKYEGLNLNPSPLPPKVGVTSSFPKPRLNGGIQNHHPFNTPHIQLVDEIAAAYPNEDFDLLRQALLRNEVTFTKLNSRVPKSNFFPPSRTGHNNNSSKNEASRSSSPSVSPAAEQSKAYSAAQAMELLRQQNEYVKFIQQAGINFPSLSPDPAYAAETVKNKSKHPWLHPLAQAAAAASMGYPGLNGQRKSQQQQQQQHTFASPKLPASNSKPKTVAAALAASRLSPNSLLSTMTSNMFEPLAPPSKRKPAIPSQRKRKPKQNKPNCTITRPPPQDEDYLDPTSILEVTTSSGSEGTNSTNGVDLTGTGNYSSYLNVNHFMAPSMNSPSPNEALVQNESPTSKLKKYLEHFSNSSPPEVPSPNVNAETDPELTKTMALEAFTFDPEVAGDARAVARKYGLSVRVVMKWVKESSSKSFPMTNPNCETNPQLKTNGTASILNGIMMNYMNSLEPSNLTVPNTISTNKTNGDSHPGNPNFDTDYMQELNFQGGNSKKGMYSTSTSSNKRKTSKPNQICDFQQDDDDYVYGNEPVDMMVPIKKRRLSTHE